MTEINLLHKNVLQSLLSEMLQCDLKPEDTE